ncbi:proteasomal ubiquitin receptor ADRM1-B-like [Ruditapes philippinarum]|uniref:proteasomal ubiquitin receptor ADRM1-B-like n=1 Tax=Ruditapes philippinarum TaxID=129788 RepID=UPI00295AE93A|nr:proteasomal ubiquitin receptor ADRM1-B-like [Ruditapes philippinarum]
MATGALFGNASGRSQSKNLVEFRAGKMYMKGKMVHPDKRKGLVYVYQSDDSLMHFCWKDRTSGSIEDDLIIFPDDIEFKHVKQCTTGRVYVLKFKSSTRKFFFWMQEPKTDKDDDNCKKVNEFLNNPPTPGSSRGAGGSGTLPSDLANLAGDSDLQSILGGMSQQQLMQLLGGMNMGGPGGGLSALMGRPGSVQSTASEPPLRVQSSPGTRGGSSDTPSQPRPVTAAALPSQNTTTTSATTGSTTTTSAGQSSSANKPAIQLSDLQNILSNMTVPAEKECKGGLLPKSEEELRATITSPQFKQALSSFSSALQSGQLGPLMTQFGLGEDVANAAAQGDLEAFVKAMQVQQKSKEAKKDQPEAMDQD